MLSVYFQSKKINDKSRDYNYRSNFIIAKWSWNYASWN